MPFHLLSLLSLPFQLLLLSLLVHSTSAMASSSSPSQPRVGSSPTLYNQVFGQSIDITAASVFPDGSGGLEVELTRSVRDVDEDRRRAWTHGPFAFDVAARQWRQPSVLRGAMPKEVSSDAKLVSRSPSGRRTMRVVGVKGGPGGEDVLMPSILSTSTPPNAMRSSLKPRASMEMPCAMQAPRRTSMLFMGARAF